MRDAKTIIEVLKRNSKLSLTIPFIRYEMDLGQALDPKTVDERIARLDQIRSDLGAAIDAVSELQREAQQNK